MSGPKGKLTGVEIYTPVPKCTSRVSETTLLYETTSSMTHNSDPEPMCDGGPPQPPGSPARHKPGTWGVVLLAQQR